MPGWPGLADSFPRPADLPPPSLVLLLLRSITVKLACLLGQWVMFASLGGYPDSRLEVWVFTIFPLYQAPDPPPLGTEKKEESRNELCCVFPLPFPFSFLLSFLVRSSFPFQPFLPRTTVAGALIFNFVCYPFASWQISGGISPVCLRSWITADPRSDWITDSHSFSLPVNLCNTGPRIRFGRILLPRTIASFCLSLTSK